MMSKIALNKFKPYLEHLTSNNKTKKRKNKNKNKFKMKLKLFYKI